MRVIASPNPYIALIVFFNTLSTIFAKIQAFVWFVTLDKASNP